MFDIFLNFFENFDFVKIIILFYFFLKILEILLTFLLFFWKLFFFLIFECFFFWSFWFF